MLSTIMCTEQFRIKREFILLTYRTAEISNDVLKIMATNR